MKKIRFVLSVMTVGALAACGTTHNSAPVVERNGGKTAETAKPSSVASKSPATSENGYYTVKKGDTLLHIALDLGQNYRDIVAWNNLANPNDIKVDQVLRVAPPEGGSAQTSGVSGVSGIEARPIAATTVAGATSKTGPRADKRPYSEGALEDMKKEDVAVGGASVKDSPKAIEKPATVSVIPPVTNAADEGISWMWPAEGKIIASFDGGKSKGIDIAGRAGQQVVAAGAGKVMYAGGDIRGYGNLVIVKHTSNLLSAYAHNKAITVKEGQNVNKGDVIAEMGNSDSDAVKLHFEIRQQGKPVDPSKFLPNRDLK